MSELFQTLAYNTVVHSDMHTHRYVTYVWVFVSFAVLTLSMRLMTIVNHWAECGRRLYSPWCTQCGRLQCCLYMLLQDREIVTMKTNRKSALECSLKLNTHRKS